MLRKGSALDHPLRVQRAALVSLWGQAFPSGALTHLGRSAESTSHRWPLGWLVVVFCGGRAALFLTERGRVIPGVYLPVSRHPPKPHTALSEPRSNQIKAGMVWTECRFILV